MAKYRIPAIALCAALSVGGCATRTFDAYAGPHAPDSDIATLRSEGGDVFEVSDGVFVPYDHLRDGAADIIRVPAGNYRIAFGYQSHTDYDFLAGNGGDGSRIKQFSSSMIDLKAGHTYGVYNANCGIRDDRCGPYPKLERLVWVRDEQTGQVVGGTAP